MKSKLRQWIIMYREWKRDNFVAHNPKFEASRLEADIVRYVHSIEKGLSIANPRLGFGVAKIEYMFSLVERYRKIEKNNLDCLYFVCDALQAYLDFHVANDFENENIINIKDKYLELKKQLPPVEEKFGGVDTISISDMDFNVLEIEKLFNTRHSIREFSGEKISDEEIKKAIKLAQRSPSACNRQGVRIYSVSSEKYMKDIGNSLEGIGGFAEDVDRFLLITGKQSAYSLSEKNQYIVSASMFGAYLTLALHAYGIAACTIQRPLTPQRSWIEFCEKNQIPRDEQLVMMIGIGKYKEKCTVPLSKRYAIDKIYRDLDE